MNSLLFDSYYHYNHSKDFYFNGHTHASREINVVTRGVLNVTYDDRIITLKKNMLMIYESEVFHRSRVMSSDGVELLVYQFYTDDIPHHNEAQVFQLDENNLALIRIITEEAEKNPTEVQHNLVQANDLNELSVKLLEILLTRLTENKIPVNYEKNPDERLYKKAITFMKKNLYRNICIDDVANYCLVSPSKIKNVFSEFAGSGVITHFSYMKFNEAKRMLREDMPIGVISEKLGYSSQAYFSLCFKKFTGVSPLKYKKENLQSC